MFMMVQCLSLRWFSINASGCMVLILVGCCILSSSLGHHIMSLGQHIMLVAQHRECQFVCHHNNSDYIAKMLPKPRYLLLEQQLSTSITLHKQLIFDNKEDGLHLQLFERVTYHSQQRVIDLTETIVNVVRKAYGLDQECQVYVYDPLVLDFRLLAYYPQQNSIVLGEQFLQADTLLFQLTRIDKLPHSSDQSEQEIVGNQYPLNEEAMPAGPQLKPKRRKNIKEMLQVVEQWRKLSSKLTMEQAADLLGLKRRTLEFYIHCAKLGEKHGYEFHLNLEKKICEVDKFLKEKSQSKKNKEMEMLEKFKLFYK